MMKKNILNKKVELQESSAINELQFLLREKLERKQRQDAFIEAFEKLLSIIAVLFLVATSISGGVISGIMFYHSQNPLWFFATGGQILITLMLGYNYFKCFEK